MDTTLERTKQPVLNFSEVGLNQMDFQAAAGLITVANTNGMF